MSKRYFEMNRSHRQVATAYSPGSLFTFEGGAVACIALPDGDGLDGQEIIPEHTRRQIHAIIEDDLRSWGQRAMTGQNPGHPIPLDLCVDGSAISGDRVHLPFAEVVFQIPTHAGFAPFPLAFQCAKCGLHRECASAARLADDMAKFRLACPSEPCVDNWRQLDFVMAHWSGTVASPTPDRSIWDSTTESVVTFGRCENCHDQRFRWVGTGRGKLSELAFACVGCGTPRELRVACIDTLTRLGPWLQASPAQAQWSEVNMEPISYRAAAAHYPHGGQLLMFADQDRMRLLESDRSIQLAQELGQKYGYPTVTLDDVMREKLLRMAGLGPDWRNYDSLRDLVAGLEKQSGFPSQQIAALKATLQGTEERWNSTVFRDHLEPSADMILVVQARREFVPRFDPIRMSVEHDAFIREKVNANALEDGRMRSILVTMLDEFTRPDGVDAEGLSQLQASSQRHLDALGIGEMRLVRDVRVCEYSFGYTRTSSLPLAERPRKAANVDLPVRLRLFDQVETTRTTGGGLSAGGVGRWRHPVLCVLQSNEGIYFRLSEATVRAWIEENALMLPATPRGVGLGGALIHQFALLHSNRDAAQMTRFLELFRRDSEIGEHAYPHVFTLLHTMAHQLVGVCSALSGLDIGSFGEQLFVPDLAVLIYRRGATMDLGNLTSMWRDRGSRVDGNEVLSRMVDPAGLRCGSEVVCMQRGGACPDCVMIPETSCLTRNEMLSRSALIGRGKPRWAKWGNGVSRRTMVGYYEVAAKFGGAAPCGS